MERGAVVRFLRNTFVLLVLSLAVAPVGAAERELVLIVSSASPVEHLDPIEIRKLFLGLPVLRGGVPLRPVCNVSDERIQEVFLQYVVAMSQSAYDHRILSLVNTQGRARPLELRSREAVLATLSADRQAVSYAWLSDVAGNPHVRILRVLWKE
jgi:hypothetical protein